MTGSLSYFVVVLFFSMSLNKLFKRNNQPQFEKYFQYSIIFAAAFFAADKVLGSPGIFKWVWHIYMFAILWFCYERKKMEGIRTFLIAFAPYIIVSFIIDIFQAIRSAFSATWSIAYIQYVGPVAFMWMIAVMYSNNRQIKIAEKERIARQKEDELNKAIAARKVELEVLVAERTSELQGQKEELQHALDDLRTTQAQLIQAEKMASLGELTAGIAHEIQNPLNFVNNFSELNAELIDELFTEIDKGNTEEVKAIAGDIKQNEEKIRHHGKRADGIVKGMLQHSRKSTGQKEMTDINALADEYLRLSYHGLRAKDKSFNATMHTEFDENAGSINIIQQDVGRVILNLLTNAFYAVNEKKQQAVKAGEKYEPTVSIATKRLPDEFLITVKDNGNGIPQKVIDKIFQPFFTTKPTGQGTGLGLSLSYDIIKAHGGEINVETKEGEGTAFVISLPLKEKP